MNVTQITVDRRIEPARFDAIEPGKSSRTQVLASLGPPKEVSYTLVEEVFHYRAAWNRSTNLQFILPTAFLQISGIVSLARGIIVGAAGQVVPEDESGAQFKDPWFLRFYQFMFGFLVAQSPVSTGGEETIELQGRRFREETVRIAIDRKTQRVVQKSLISPEDLKIAGLARDTLLQD